MTHEAMIDAVANVLPLRIASSVVRFDNSLPGWTLLEPGGDRPRTYTAAVTFDRSFAIPPVVQAGLSGFDIENGDAARIKLRVAAVRADGFDVALETWFETRVWSIDVSWLAIGH